MRNYFAQNQASGQASNTFNDPNNNARYLTNLGLGLLGGSGYSTMPQSFGSIFAKAAQGANEQQQQREEQEYKKALLGMQLKKYQKEANQPISVGAGQTLIDPETYEPIYTNPRSTFGSTPAALQLANEYETALKAGDIDRANNIIMFSKTLDKGITYDQSGNPMAIPGYAPARANIAATVKGAEQTAKNQSDLDYAANIEKQKMIGRGEVSDIKKRDVGQNQVNAIADQMAGNYQKLNQTGGIIDPAASSVKNIKAGLKSSALGQYLQGKAGSPEQSVRNQINSQIPALINSIRQSTGMSAKAMDSNAELQFYLKQATDPKVDIQTNLKALESVKSLYGKGQIQNSRLLSDNIQPTAPQQSTQSNVISYQDYFKQ